MAQVTLFLLSLLFIGCSEPVFAPIEMIKVKIVAVYDERRIGKRDGTTIIECPNNTRSYIKGKMGQVGEVIMVMKSKC